MSQQPNYNNISTQPKSSNNKTGILIGGGILLIIFMMLVVYLMYTMMAYENAKDAPINSDIADWAPSLDDYETIYPDHIDGDTGHEAVEIIAPDGTSEMYRLGEYYKDGWKAYFDGNGKAGRSKGDGISEQIQILKWDKDTDTKNIFTWKYQTRGMYDVWATTNKYTNINK